MGALQIFVLNKKWAFRFHNLAILALLKYFVACGTGYITNFLALIFCVKLMGLPYQIVRGVMIISLVIELFFAQ